MQQRNLTKDLAVSALGLGCMGMSEFYGSSDPSQSLRVLHRAADLGVNFLDTADTYGLGANEELIGQFLSETNTRPTIATKFGIQRARGNYARTINNSKDYVVTACEASLRRLGVECIDLYYVHRIETGRPIEEPMEALAGLARAGKIRHVGLCEVSASTLRRANRIFPVSVVQSEYSLWTRTVEETVLPTCQELGIGFVAYSPLGRGFLTGSLGPKTHFGKDDVRASLPRFSRENLKHNQAMVRTIRTLSEKHDCAPGQIALAWLLAKGDHIVPIPGTKRIEYLEENYAAFDISLPPTDVEQLESLIASVPVAGDRYTEEGMKGVNG